MPEVFWLVMVLMFMNACVLATLNYQFNSHRWYVPALFVFCNCLNGLWLWMVKTMNGNKDLIYQGAWIWFVIFNTASLLLPAIWFDIKITPLAAMGICLIVFGVVLLRLGT
jgi:multidrug transporter EmrE-like cation transporter